MSIYPDSLSMMASVDLGGIRCWTIFVTRLRLNSTMKIEKHCDLGLGYKPHRKISVSF